MRLNRLFKTPRSRGRRAGGFTLLELVLVMLIVATALAIASPSLTNWSHGQKLRTSAEDLVALTHYARAQAVFNSTVYRVQLADSGTFTLYKQQGTDFIATKDPQGLAVSVPPGGKVEFTRIATNTSEQPDSNTGAQATGDAAKALDFDPTGRSATATIKIYDEQGKYLTIENTSPLEQFHIVAPTS